MWIESCPMTKANILLSAALRVLHHQQKAADGPVCYFVLKRWRRQREFVIFIRYCVGHFVYKGLSKDILRFLYHKNCLCLCKEIFPHVSMSFSRANISRWFLAPFLSQCSKYFEKCLVCGLLSSLSLWSILCFPKLFVSGHRPLAHSCKKTPLSLRHQGANHLERGIKELKLRHMTECAEQRSAPKGWQRLDSTPDYFCLFLGFI